MADDNKIRYGLSEVHVAFHSDTAESGFEAPISVPGAINLDLSAEGGETNFYADNHKYFTRKKNDGWTGSLEMALFPDSVKARMFGYYIDTDGNLVEDADGVPETFALMAQVEGDKKGRRTVWYDVTASRPNNQAQTSEDSISPQTETADVVCVPHKFASIGKMVPSLSCSEGDTAYAGFFEAVVVPKAPKTE